MLTDKELEEIRRKMLELEEEPPTDGWKNIRAEVQPPDKDWRPIGWFGVVILLLITTIGAYFLLRDKPVADEAVVPGQVMAGADKITTVTGQEVQGIRASVAADAGRTAETRQQESSAVPAPASAENVLPKRTGSSSTRKIPVEAPQNKPAAQEQVVKPEQSITPAGRKPVQAEKPVVWVGGEKEETDTQDPPQNGKMATAEFIAPVGVAPVEKLKSLVPAMNLKDGLVLPDLRSASLIINGKTTAEPVEPVEAVAPKEEKRKVRQKDRQKKEWYLGLTMAPRYAFRSFKPATADEIYITNLNNRKRLDPERMGYEFGLNMGKKIRQQLYLETSLSLMQLRENVDYSYTVGEVDTVLKSITGNGTVKLTPVYREVERQLKSSYAYGGLRVGLTYFFLERAQSRFNITTAAGVNLLVKGRTEEYIDGEYNETIIFPSKDNILEQSNYNLLIGAGYNLTLRDKYELMVMPTLNYFLGSTFHEREPFGLRPYTLGISFQVRRSFNR